MAITFLRAGKQEPICPANRANDVGLRHTENREDGSLDTPFPSETASPDFAGRFPSNGSDTWSPPA